MNAERIGDKPPQPRLADQFEQMFGGKVLAWLGGIATLLGLVFLVGIALDRGWIDESMRIALGFAASTLLLLAGVWLYERKGHTEAALAAVASAFSGLYATLLVGTQIYDLIPAYLGLAGAGLVGVVSVAIALRWDSRIVAGVGTLGALGAPLLVGSGTTVTSLAFMAIAMTTAVGILLWRKWNWLALGAFAVSAPQLLFWVWINQDEHLAGVLAALVGFWALYVVAAVGYELRIRTPDRLPVPSLLLLLANVALIATAGFFALEQTDHPTGAVVWLLGMAGGHILLGALARRQEISEEIGSLFVALGLGLSAFGFANAVDGPVLVVGWAIQAALLAFLATRASTDPAPLGSNAERLMVGAGVSLGLALGHTLLFEAPPEAIALGVADLGEAIVGLGACAAAALSGWLVWRGRDPRIGKACEAVAAVVLLYLGSVTIIDTLGVTDSGETRQIGQSLLSVFWALSGLGAVIYGLLRDIQRFRIGGLALLALAIVKVYTYDLAALEQLPRVLSFIALGLFLLIGAFAYQRIKVETRSDVEEATAR